MKIAHFGVNPGKSDIFMFMLMSSTNRNKKTVGSCMDTTAKYTALRQPGAPTKRAFETTKNTALPGHRPVRAPVIPGSSGKF